MGQKDTDELPVDPVESTEPTRKEELEKPSTEKDKPVVPTLPEGELSEEDKALKEKLEGLVAVLLTGKGEVGSR
jgi:hypothetical protein